MYLNTSDIPYCDIDMREQITRDYNVRTDHKTAKLKVINDFLQDINGHIEGNNLIIGDKQYTTHDILEEEFIVFTERIRESRRNRTKHEIKREKEDTIGPMMEKYYIMLQAERETGGISPFVLGTKFIFDDKKVRYVIQGNDLKMDNGVFIPQSQYSDYCGLHAINNLLQINTLDCLVNRTNCAPGTGGRRPGKMMLATDIISTINEGHLKDNFFAVEWIDLVKVIDINSIDEISQKFGKDLPPAFKNDEDKAKQLVGVIERVGVAHWVAWLHKGENWYKIDSIGEAQFNGRGNINIIERRGTMTKYNNDVANRILTNRPKHDIAQLTIRKKYEHILVFSNQILEGCNFINREATYGGALKTRHSKKVFREIRKKIKSKKRLF